MSPAQVATEAHDIAERREPWKAAFKSAFGRISGSALAADARIPYLATSPLTTYDEWAQGRERCE
jgi:hypothetical protein